MKKYFYLGTMLLAGLMVSCKDETMSDGICNESNVAEEAVYSIRLVDEAGNQVTSLDGQFAQLYVEVEAQGEWCLSTSNPNYVYLTTEVGRDNGRVPVFVSTCWAGSRAFSIEATPRSCFDPSIASAPATRGAGSSTVSTDSIHQKHDADLAAVAKRLSSNLGAGYTVSIANTNNLLLKTQMQVFNLSRLDSLQKALGVDLINDDIAPVTNQKYIESNSKSSLVNQVTVGVNGKIGSGSLNGSNITGDVSVSDNADTTATYAVRRQLSTFFTRQIFYENCAFYDSLALSPGFRMTRNNLERELKTLLYENTSNKADTLMAYRLLDEFIREVGPNVIIKSNIGCVLDYYIKVQNSSMDKGYSVSAVLDFKYASQVKDTAKTASADSTKFNFGGDVNVENRFKKCASNSEIEVVISGGDVKSVDILCNGGQLTTADIQRWQQSITPENSLLIDMEVVPISYFFKDTFVKNFIYEYLVALGLTERVATK